MWIKYINGLGDSDFEEDLSLGENLTEEEVIPWSESNDNGISLVISNNQLEEEVSSDEKENDY